ncbi:MAG: hypothetical protein AABY88_00405 [Pseudomonadota bacterium]
MRLGNKSSLVALFATAAFLTAIPALSQDNPKSLLPPGFGEPEPEPKPADDKPQKPIDLLPDASLKLPSSGASSSPAPQPTDPNAVPLDLTGPLTEEEKAALAVLTPPVLQDLPPGARRSTANIGIIDAEGGGMGPAAFGRANGHYLSVLMRKLHAPIASRWTSILLRRALTSKVDTPAGVSGADWVAERAWLLIRMGEADAARLMVQSVDVDQFTPKMFEVAMQASLANADPAGLCPLVESALEVSKEPAWRAVRAICSALAGESAQASAQIDGVRSKGPGRGIDGLLAEKVVGAGGNTRRAVVIEWDDVSILTAWRYGLATATGLVIPDRLMAGAGPQVRAWLARAPLLPVNDRTASAEIAASLGVLSSAALVDHYGAVSDVTDPADANDKPFTMLRAAYAAQATPRRLEAMRQLWDVQTQSEPTRYARLIVTARAAGRLQPSDEAAEDIDRLIASMLSAGLDVQASRWAKQVNDASGDPAMRAWGLLAVGSPSKVVEWSLGRIRSYQSNAGNENARRGEFIFAAMAGLGRIDAKDVEPMAEDLAVPIGTQTRWTRALQRAVMGNEPATVALLCAIGLQKQNFKDIPAVQLYHVISALRRVGYANEARMIAAEALTRS